MNVVSHGNWDYHIQVSPTEAKNRFAWQIVRSPKGISFRMGTLVASGEADSTEAAERQAQEKLREILADPPKEK